jgi:hypothetical protein
MPPSTTTADAASSVQISFYDADGTLNTDFGGQLHDSRDSIGIVLSGDSSKVLSAQAFLDSADATSTASLKSYPLQIGTSNTIVETDEAFAGMAGSYDFALNTPYVVKLKITSNISPYNAFYARFSIGGAAATPSYSFLYRTVSDTLTPSVENVDEIQTGSTIKIAAPMSFPDSSDARRPKDMIFTFDVYESLTDLKNDEGLSSYTVTQEYNPSPSGKYELEDNQLQNDNKYALTVTAVYADGYSISKNVVEPIYVVPQPIIDIATSQAYGLGNDNQDAGDLATSTVAIVYLNPSSTPKNIQLFDNNVTFEFKQGANLCYQITMPANSTTNSYTVLSTDTNFTKKYTNAPPLQNPDSSGTYTFDVYASFKYVKHGSSEGYFVKTSLSWIRNFTYDIVPLTNVQIENAWVNASVTTVNSKLIVDNTNVLSISGYNKASKLCISGKFPKTNFFGSGRSGTFKDLDTEDTQFLFEISINNGVKVPVPELALMQGGTTNGVKDSDQQNYVDILDVVPTTTQGGKVDNIPHGTAVLGSDQPDIYFLIPLYDDLFEQTNEVEVTVSITSKTKGVTLPAGTTSNSVTMVNKVSEYSMAVGSDSEPYMSGSGANTQLTVPIDVSTNIETGDYYLSSATFYSTLAAPNNDVTVAQSNSGKFNIVLTNVSPVDANCEYHVAYIITHPEIGIIEGPSLQEYQIPLSDEPTVADNLEVTNYLYTTFAGPTGSKVAGFSFDIKFKDVTKDGRRLSPDGANVYFKNGSDMVLVKKVMRDSNDVQTGINVVLQSTPPTALDAGVNVMDSAGDVGSFWKKWSKGEIMIRAFKTPNVVSDNDAQGPDSTDSVSFDIFNVAPINAPTDFELTGGVIEMYKETSVRWDNTLSDYGSDVTASYVLTLSTSVNTAPVDKSAEITTVNTSDSYAINIKTLPANTEYKMALLIKLAGNNGYVWHGTTQTITFTSVSVNESSRAVSVKRDSGINVLKASFGSHITDPVVASNLVNVERKIVDNVNSVSDPENSSLKVLENGTSDAVHADNVTHSYNIMNAGYIRGNNLRLQVRSKVSVTYTLTTGAGAPAPQTSVPQYISLAATPKTRYTVAAAPLLTVDDSYTVQNNQIIIPFKCDAMGLETQGLSSLTAILSQESDLTDAGDANAGQGAVALLSYGPHSNIVTPGIFSFNGVSTNLTDAQMTAVKSDSTISVTTAPGVNGWGIKNGAASVVNGVVTGFVPKVNLYFYGNTVAAASQTSSNSFALNQASGLGLYAIFIQNSNANQYPFFVAYTTPTSADNRETWYKSKVLYAPASGSPLNAGLTLAYGGTDDLSFRPDIPPERRVKYNFNLAYSNANAEYNTELVNLISLQTSSNPAETNAGDFDFHLLETGVNTNHASIGLVSLEYNVYSEYSRTSYSYATGPDASATVATDYLAGGENRTTIPENLTDAVGAIESGNYELRLGTLGLNDESKIILPSLSGFDATKNIVVVMIAHTYRGTSVSSKNIFPSMKQVLTSTAAPTSLAPGATLNLADFVTSDNTDPNAQPIIFFVSGTANSGSYNSTTNVISAGTSGTWTVTASQAGYTKSSGIVVISASITFTIAVTYITFNGTTYKYTGPVAGLSNPIITKGPGDVYFAVMSNDNDWESRPLLKKYIRQGYNDDQASTLDRFRAPDGNPVSLDRIVTNLMTNMNNLFNEFGTGSRITAESITSWDVSNVTDMSNMFENAINFNQDLRNWNVSSVTEFTNFRKNSSITVANCPTFKVPAGITWTSRSSPNNNGTTWNSIAYGNGKFVATGANDIMTSSDGITWTSVTPPAAYNVWNSVTYGNGMFVAVASNGKAMTSSDGSTWNETFAAYNNMGEQVTTNMSWSSVAFGSNIFVATGHTFNNSTGIMTSTDGIYWIIRNSNVANADLNSVTFGNGTWVTVGANKIMTSYNAAVWMVTSSNSGNLNSVTYANGTFVAVGGSGLVMTSPDGFSWTNRTSTGTQNWTSVTYGNDNKLFVAVAVTGNGNKVMTSPDGITWIGRPSPDDSWLSVSYHPNNTYVAVGYHGKIMSSTSVIVQLN